MARFLWVLALGWLLAAPCAAAPLEAYGRLPTIEAVEISPDGAMLASIVTAGEQRTFRVTRVADGSLVVAAVLGDAKIRDLRWAGLDHVLITRSVTSYINGVMAPRGEYFLAVDFDLKARRTRNLLSDVKGGLNIVARYPEVRLIDGRPMVILTGFTFPSQKGRATVFRVDIEKSFNSKLIETGVDDAVDLVVDAQGQPLAQMSLSRTTGRWAIRLKQNSRWREVARPATLTEPPDLMGLGRDGRKVLVSITESGRVSLVEISPEDGTVSAPFATDDADGLLWNPSTYALQGYVSLKGDESRAVFFEPAAEKVWRAVTKAFPGQGVQRVSMTENGRQFVILADSPTEGPAYALVDLQTKHATWIGAQYAGLLPKDISEVRPIRYKAADGLELSGYLTLPPGRAAKGLPLVVLPHGGPAVRDRPGFDWWAQALASRGYAVLQVNYRGSDGFGWPFLSAGFGQWGRKMQTDLSDGVRHLAAEGLIDPKRVCIVGGSYGGYAALAGATFDRGVYRCAASIAGPADLRKLVVFSRQTGGVVAQRYWLRFMGAKTMSDPGLGEISPSEHADAVDIPILLVHGRDDTVVPLQQSQIMADALKKAGKPYELVVMKGEDHWLTRGETRLQMLQAVAGFLERNNPPG